jgi:hypothetical protein
MIFIYQGRLRRLDVCAMTDIPNLHVFSNSQSAFSLHP